ncbi:hypothetical protein TNCV_604451 [Trichonephila clavipes]|nr:hypothetical protein TNCV_604451 [Trichonephila clavipes]
MNDRSPRTLWNEKYLFEPTTIDHLIGTSAHVPQRPMVMYTGMVIDANNAQLSRIEERTADHVYYINNMLIGGKLLGKFQSSDHHNEKLKGCKKLLVAKPGINRQIWKGEIVNPDDSD